MNRSPDLAVSLSTTTLPQPASLHSLPHRDSSETNRSFQLSMHVYVGGLNFEHQDLQVLYINRERPRASAVRFLIRRLRVVAEYGETNHLPRKFERKKKVHHNNQHRTNRDRRSRRHATKPKINKETNQITIRIGRPTKQLSIKNLDRHLAPTPISPPLDRPAGMDQASSSIVRARLGSGGAPSAGRLRSKFCSTAVAATASASLALAS